MLYTDLCRLAHAARLESLASPPELRFACLFTKLPLPETALARGAVGSPSTRAFSAARDEPRMRNVIVRPVIPLELHTWMRRIAWQRLVVELPIPVVANIADLVPSQLHAHGWTRRLRRRHDWPRLWRRHHDWPRPWRRHDSCRRLHDWPHLWSWRI